MLKNKFPAFDAHHRERTPYAVVCNGIWDMPELGCCGLVYLTEEEYNKQLLASNKTWRCPICKYEADWNDENYEEMSRQKKKIKGLCG